MGYKKNITKSYMPTNWTIQKKWMKDKYTLILLTHMLNIKKLKQNQQTKKAKQMYR